KFTPADHDIPAEVFSVDEAKIKFFTPGDFTFHVFGEGTASQPGDEITSFNVNVSTGEVQPNWKIVDLRSIPEMADRTDPFWIWVESIDGAQCNILGDDLVWGMGHYYSYNGTSATEYSLYEFCIRVMGSGALGVGDQITLSPDRYELSQNFPNPFNPETSIAFSLAKDGHTTLRVYNMLGEQVAELANGNMTAGVKNVTFDASQLSSGIYFYRLESGDFTVAKKMVLMK
nr:T9SS type A sorting domain-containing protein [FCB group bacterium]